jgi:hypothetical protein
MKSAKNLLLFNVLYDPSIYFDSERVKTIKEKKIFILTYKYNKDENDLLQKYIQKSIDLREPSTEDRLKKIVLFFSKHDKSQSYLTPSEDQDGLQENYQKDIEYIIGPHARFDPPKTKTVDRIRIDKKLQQLCVRCNPIAKKLQKEFHLTIQEEVNILHITDSEIEKIGKHL